MDWRFCLLKMSLLDASFVSKMVESGAAEGGFKDYWERFAAHLEQLDRSPLTIKNYRSDLKAFVEWLNKPGQALPNLTKVGSKEMRQYQEFLLTQQKLSPSSVNRRLGALKNFYTWLQQTEGLTNDRLPRMPDPVRRVSVARVDPLSQVEQQNLLDAVQQGQNQRDYAMLNMLLSTGVRAGGNYVSYAGQIYKLVLDKVSCLCGRGKAGEIGGLGCL
jgi:site-specific recombinase XerD